MRVNEDLDVLSRSLVQMKRVTEELGIMSRRLMKVKRVPRRGVP